MFCSSGQDNLLLWFLLSLEKCLAGLSLYKFRTGNDVNGAVVARQIAGREQ